MFNFVALKAEKETDNGGACTVYVNKTTDNKRAWLNILILNIVKVYFCICTYL